MNFQEVLTRKYGPLTAWQWGLIVAGVGYFILRQRKSSAPVAADNGQKGPDGEFQSSQTQTTTDPKTGEQRTSSYSATGSLGGWGGGVGVPMGYPMPYTSPGDVYVNLPGDTEGFNPGRPVIYPPKTGPGVGPGRVGGFWWTPLNRNDVYNIAAKPYGDDMGRLSPDAQNAARIAMNYARIVDANPQIEWAKISGINDVIGRPIYIPGGSTGDDKTVGYMPPNASLNAPQGYNPPTQQTGVSGTA